MNNWEIVADKSQQSPDGVRATSQPLTLTGERSGLLTRIGYGKRFIVRADEMLTAFMELEAAIRKIAVSCASLRSERFDDLLLNDGINVFVELRFCLDI